MTSPVVVDCWERTLRAGNLNGLLPHVQGDVHLANQSVNGYTSAP